MQNINFFPTCLIVIVFLIGACSSSEPKQPAPEDFLTLADLTGKVMLKEDSPDVRVIRIKTKAFIKLNDIRTAKAKAIETAQVQAVDLMIQELLIPEIYNNKYEIIEEYISKNVQKYVEESEVNDEKKIFGGTYYGIDSAIKVNRQKVLVALQKDLKLVNTNSSTIVTVITSKKDLDLSASGFTFSDIEDAMMNQIQTDLNQRGLRAMDFRNAVASAQTDEKLKEKFSKISKDQFMALVAGSPAARALLDKQIQNAEEFYETGISLLKLMAKVVIEVNIFSVSGNVQGDLALSLNVTAKNVSTGRGGALANTVINVARRGGSNTIASAMITGLVKDAYSDMETEFIPQVIKEMSTISVGGKYLKKYDLVFQNFKSKEIRGIKRKLDQSQSDDFRRISFDNSVPTIVSIGVRYSDDPKKSLERLADKIMNQLDDASLNYKEPIIAPDLYDLVFLKLPNEE